MKKSKLTRIEASGTWKEFFKFDLEFENEEMGTMFKKTENHGMVVGEEYQYTRSEKGSIKIIKEGYGTGGNFNYTTKDDVQRFIIRQSCLNRATDIAIAMIEKSGKIEEELIMQQAERFEEWVLCKNINNNSKALPF